MDNEMISLKFTFDVVHFHTYKIDATRICFLIATWIWLMVWNQIPKMINLEHWNTSRIDLKQDQEIKLDQGTFNTDSKLSIPW